MESEAGVGSTSRLMLPPAQGGAGKAVVSTRFPCLVSPRRPADVPRSIPIASTVATTGCSDGPSALARGQEIVGALCAPTGN